MEFPDDIKYTKDHEWVRTEANGIAYVGITSYAIEQLGDIVFVELPEEGESYDASAPFGTVESTKTVSDLYMPLDAEILETNSAVVDSPESLQDDPYKDGWLVKVKLASPGTGELMSAAEYQEFIKED